MKILPKNKVVEALNIMANSAEVYAPIYNGVNEGYFQWTDNDNDELLLNSLNTVISPKSVIIPQTEKMYAFATGTQTARIGEVYTSPKDRVIFGIRGCDLKAILATDMVFLTRGFVDEFYKERRDHVTIVANACYHPGKGCFCKDMGVNPYDPEGADVLIVDLGTKGYGWEVRTDKGEALTAKIANLLEEGEYEYPEKDKFARSIDMTGVPEKMAGMFESPVWDTLAERCMNCGICTNACPSCYCFDIQVKTWGDEGYRFRCWDSCMYSEYSTMAGGHNPRADKKERYRNRFMHKLDFFHERYNEYLCTGCGRCVVLCPNQVSIVEVINQVKEA